MKDENCPSCIHLQHDCGGHWSTRTRAHTGYARPAGKMTLDVYDGTHEHGGNAYTYTDTEDDTGSTS